MNNLQRIVQSAARDNGKEFEENVKRELLLRISNRIENIRGPLADRIVRNEGTADGEVSIDTNADSDGRRVGDYLVEQGFTIVRPDHHFKTYKKHNVPNDDVFEFFYRTLLPGIGEILGVPDGDARNGADGFTYLKDYNEKENAVGEYDSLYVNAAFFDAHRENSTSKNIEVSVVARSTRNTGNTTTTVRTSYKDQ